MEHAKKVLDAFAAERVDYVLIGSIAMAAQGIVRATRDIDLFVSGEAENVARLRRALKGLFDDDPNVDEITAEDLNGSYPAIRYVPPHGEYVLDFLTRLGDAFHFEDLESEELDLDGIPIRVATPRMLYDMKKGTLRPQDRLDAEMLRQRFALEGDG